jgi:ABC-type branched-subunit amino acid transport system substrate-binding protein
MNSTLRSHCETIYSYLLQNHGSDKIYLCRKKGSQEDKIADYFKNINEADGKKLLNIETINFIDDFNTLGSKLDSTQKSIIIGASLNDDFATGLVNAAFGLRNNYNLDVIGMPNWNSFSDLKKSSLADFGITYTTPYYNAKMDKHSRKIIAAYTKSYKSAPSEMSFKGFEAVYMFTKLIAMYPDDFSSHINDMSKVVFNEYNFKPVYVTKKSDIPDYFENKHLYFMKILNGKLVRTW